MAAYENQIETSMSEVSRQTQILEEVEFQPEVVAMISQAINELEKRLVGVLRTEDDEVSINGSEPHQVLVPLAEQLHVNNDRLKSSHRRLMSILHRLEL